MPLTTSTMKSKCLAILGFSALVALFGCRTPPSDVPVNGCRLTIENISTNAGNPLLSHLKGRINSEGSCSNEKTQMTNKERRKTGRKDSQFRS